MNKTALVNSVRVDDWTAKLAIIASNVYFFSNYTKLTMSADLAFCVSV